MVAYVFSFLCYVICFVCLRSVSCIQCYLVYLEFQFLITLSIFSNVYLLYMRNDPELFQHRQYMYMLEAEYIEMYKH
jgi:hypothetical protein